MKRRHRLRPYDRNLSKPETWRQGDRKSLLGLMNVLLDSETPPEEKEEFIENQYGIPMTENVKDEVSTMCNFSDGIYDRGYNSGYDKGKDSMLNQMIDNMLKANFSVDQIKVASGKSEEYIEARRKSIQENNLVGA